MQVTLLKEENIWGDNALDVMKAYGTQTSLTDLAVLKGGMLASSLTTIEGKKNGYHWSASSYGYGSCTYIACSCGDGDQDLVC